MTSVARMNLKSVLFFALFIALCPAESRSQGQVETAKALAHVPWNLLSERLRVLGESNNSVEQTLFENETLSAAGLDWKLSRATMNAQLSIGQTNVNGTGASVVIPHASLSLFIDSISIDQIVERDLGGAIARIRITASCGPIRMTQNQASTAANFALDWTSGVPRATLSALLLDWAANSWTVEAFTCAGPGGLDTLMHDEIVKQLADPAVFKPKLASYISSTLGAKLAAVFEKIQAPLDLSTGSASVGFIVGAMRPVSSGLIADLTLGSSALSQPSAAADLPSAAVLAALRLDRPAMIGGLDTIQLVVNNELASRPAYPASLDLQTVSAFHKLMQSRFMQFFGWRDLMKYPKNYPFYLRVKNPGALKLSMSGTNELVTTFPLSSIIQSYRDSQWWSYVTIQGPATANVALGVNTEGALTYKTVLSSVDEVAIAYGADYKAKFKPSGKIPSSTLRKSIIGEQSALSGAFAWPTMDLGEAGRYKLNSLKWIGSKAFVMDLKLEN